jgi:hypothetical protein
MKTTTEDKIAFVCVLAVLVLIAGVWVYAVAMERHARRMATQYAQPLPGLDAALAAAATGAADDADAVRLARGQ